MLSLMDGPCKGVFLVKTAPDFLRAVIDKKGETDVLDQLEDKPKASETVYVYKLVGNRGHIHICMSPRSHSGFYALGDYSYLPEVNGADLRDNTAWESWVKAQKVNK